MSKSSNKNTVAAAKRRMTLSLNQIKIKKVKEAKS